MFDTFGPYTCVKSGHLGQHQLGPLGLGAKHLCKSSLSWKTFCFCLPGADLGPVFAWVQSYTVAPATPRPSRPRLQKEAAHDVGIGPIWSNQGTTTLSNLSLWTAQQQKNIIMRKRPTSTSDQKLHILTESCLPINSARYLGPSLASAFWSQPGGKFRRTLVGRVEQFTELVLQGGTPLWTNCLDKAGKRTSYGSNPWSFLVCGCFWLVCPIFLNSFLWQELMAVSTHLERTTDSTGCSASLAPNRRSNGTALEDQRPAHDATLNLSLCLETCWKLAQTLREPRISAWVPSSPLWI